MEISLKRKGSEVLMMDSIDLKAMFKRRGFFGIRAHFAPEIDEFFAKTMRFFADFGVVGKGVTESFAFAYFASNHF